MDKHTTNAKSSMFACSVTVEPWTSIRRTSIVVCLPVVGPLSRGLAYYERQNSMLTILNVVFERLDQHTTAYAYIHVVIFVVAYNLCITVVAMGTLIINSLSTFITCCYSFILANLMVLVCVTKSSAV